ncbi:MAG: DNA recombination protein RmuC [Spirochaetales bacterium]
MYIPTEVVAIGITLLLVLAVVLAIIGLRRSASSGSEAVARVEGRLAEIEAISNRVDELAALFAVPRTRGEVGEMVLSDLLANYLPGEAYSLQHGFSDGGRVDAAIRLSETIVPVDAKFPLEALRRHDQEHPDKSELPASVRKTFVSHAKTIASRYIRPEEGTMDFALMYIPSEGIYHRVFVTDPGDTMREVLSLRVVPVSPGTLFLYLLTVSYGLRGLAFSRERNELISHVSAVRREFNELSRTVDLLRGHLKNATRAADECDTRLSSLDRGLHRLEE